MIEKYSTAGQATDNIIQRVCFTWWVTVDTDTHSEYVTITAFLGRQRLGERASLLCQVHCQPCYDMVLILVPVTYITLSLIYLHFLRTTRWFPVAHCSYQFQRETAYLISHDYWIQARIKDNHHLTNNVKVPCSMLFLHRPQHHTIVSRERQIYQPSAKAETDSCKHR